MVVALAVAKLRQTDGIIVALAGLAPAVVTFGVLAWTERARWRNPVENYDAAIRGLRQDPRMRPPTTHRAEPELAELTHEIAALAKLLRSRPFTRSTVAAGRRFRSRPATGAVAGILDAQRTLRRTARGRAHAEPDADPSISGDYSTADMVNRLDPVGFRWIESSTAEQILLGWTLEELRQKSFLEVLHPDDRRRAEETFAQALSAARPWG